MPTSCCTSRDSAWLLMRAEARGLSGILIASTPTDFRNRAPSISLRMSVPLGGTISTMVRNSPAAILAPSSGTLRQRQTAGAALSAASLGVFDGADFGPRLADPQGRLHDADVVGRGAAASADQAHSRSHEFARVTRHVFRRAQIDVAAFDRARHAGIGLGRQRQGSEGAHPLDRVQHGHRADAAIAADDVGTPAFNPGRESFPESSRRGSCRLRRW